MWFALVLLQASAARPHVTVTLVPEHTVIVPGTATRVALRFQVEPGWHVYWRNPGESGVATTVAWTLPPGFSADSLEFPTPARLDVAGVVTHILEGDVVVQTTLRVSGAAHMASGLPVTAQVKYGVCKDVCYPGEATVRVAPGLGDSGQGHPEWPVVDSLFAATHPRANGLRATVRVDRDTARVSFTLPRGCAAGEVTFFPWDREVSPAAVTVPVPRGCGQTVIRVPLKARPAGALQGVVVFGTEKRGYEIGN